MESLEQKTDSIPVHNLLNKIISTDSTTTHAINDLAKADSGEIKKQIALDALKKKEYVDAVYYFRNNNGENDKILIDIANGLVDKFINLTESGSPDFGIRDSQLYHSILAVEGIKEPVSKKRQANIIGDRIFEEVVKRFGYNVFFCSQMYKIGDADDKLSALSDHLVDNYRPRLFSTLGTDLTAIFQSMSDFGLFEEKVKKTINHFIKDQNYSAQIVKDLLYASHPKNHQTIKLSEKEVQDIAQFAVKIKHYPLIADLFKEYKGFLKNFATEDMADTCFKHELEKDGKVLTRELFYVEQLYDSIKMSNDKIKSLAKSAERKNEFSFAGAMYDRTKDKDSLLKMIETMKKKHYFSKACSLTFDHLVGEHAAVNSMKFQKPFFDIFIKALAASSREYRYAMLHVYPEIIYPEIIGMGDALLNTADDRHDIYEIERHYMKSERVLTKDKISALSELFAKNGEQELSGKIRDIERDPQLTKDRFYLIKKNKRSKLYYILSDYFENKETIRESDGDIKEKFQKYNVNNLSRLKSEFGLKNTNSARNVLESFSVFEGSVRLTNLAKKAFDMAEYDYALQYLKLSKDTAEIKNMSKRLLKKKEFDYARKYLQECDPQLADKIISESLMKHMVRGFKKDVSKGLELLMQLSQNKDLGEIKLSMSQNDFSEGVKAKQVSKLSINSTLLKSSVIVKIEKQGDAQYEKYDDLEYKILQNFKMKAILLPKAVIYGKTAGLNINVYSIVNGDTISAIFAGKQDLHDKDYEFLKRIVGLFDDISKNTDNTLNKLSDKDTDYKKLLIKKQEDLDLENMAKAENLFGNDRLKRIYEEKLSNISAYPGQWCKDNNASNIMHVPTKDTFGFIDFNVIEYRPKEFDIIKFIDTPNFLTDTQREELISRLSVDKERLNAMSQYLNLRHFISRYSMGDIETAKFFARRSGIPEITSIA